MTVDRARLAPLHPVDSLPQHGADRPAVTEADIDRHTEVFRESVAALAGVAPLEAEAVSRPGR
jgi:hypothetical protein